jgi:hypothetical protein
MKDVGIGAAGYIFQNPGWRQEGDLTSLAVLRRAFAPITPARPANPQRVFTDVLPFERLELALRSCSILRERASELASASSFITARGFGMSESK